MVAAAGLSNETTCAGNAMHVDWARAPGNGSPFTYWMKVGYRGPSPGGCRWSLVVRSWAAVRSIPAAARLVFAETADSRQKVDGLWHGASRLVLMW